MFRRRNYWLYSAGLAVVWAVVLLRAVSIRGTHRAKPYLLVFLGYVIAWVSGTIARYVYPPPSKWTKPR